MGRGREGTRVSQLAAWGGGVVSRAGTHLERHSSLNAWIAMRVIFTDIKQKGNC